MSLIQPFPYNLINDEDDYDFSLTNFIKDDMSFVYTVTEINKTKIKKEKCDIYYFGNNLNYENEIEDEDKIFDSCDFFSSNNHHNENKNNFYDSNKNINTYSINGSFDEDDEFDYDDDIVYELLKKIGQSTLNPLCIYILKPMIKLIKSYAPSKEELREFLTRKQKRSREIKNITTVKRIDESLFHKLSPEDIERFNWYGYPMNDEKSNVQVKLKLKLKPSNQCLNTNKKIPITKAIVDKNNLTNNLTNINSNYLLNENETKSNILFQDKEINYTNDFDTFKFQQANLKNCNICNDNSLNQQNDPYFTTRNINFSDNHIDSNLYNTLNNKENNFSVVKNSLYPQYNETFCDNVKRLNEFDNQNRSSSSINGHPNSPDESSSTETIKYFKDLPESPIYLTYNVNEKNRSQASLIRNIVSENRVSENKVSENKVSENNQIRNSLNSLHDQNLSEWEILDKISLDILERNKSVFEDEENIKQFNREYHLKGNNEFLTTNDFFSSKKLNNSSNNSQTVLTGDSNEYISNEMNDDNTKVLSNSSSVTEFNDNEQIEYSPSAKPPVYLSYENKNTQYINDELKEKLRYSQQVNQQYLNEIEEECNKRRDLEDKLTKSVNEVKEYSNVITDMESLIKDYSNSLNIITTIKSNLFKLEQEANNLKIENSSLKEKHKKEKEELEKEKKDLLCLINQYKFKENSEIDRSSEFSEKSSSSSIRRRNSFDDNILSKKREIEEMEGNINNNRKSIILFNEQIKYKENEINHLKDSLNEYNNKISCLEGQIEMKDKEILNLQDTIKESDEERKKYIQNMNKVEIPDNLISLNKYEDLKQKVTEQKTKIDAYVSENKNLQKEQEKQKEKLEEYIKENETLINNINKEKDINNDLKRKNLKLNKSVENIQQKFDNLFSEVVSKLLGMPSDLRVKDEILALRQRLVNENKKFPKDLI